MAATEYKLSYTASEIDERLRKAGNGILSEEQTLTKKQQAQARANIGLTYFGTSYADACQNIDLNADGTVKMYLFLAADGYDAVVTGSGAIADYVYTDADYENAHSDGRPYDAGKIVRLHVEKGVTYVGNYFMYKAYRLKHLSFADSTAITNLGTKAFAYTSICGEYDFTGVTDTKLDAPLCTALSWRG